MAKWDNGVEQILDNLQYYNMEQLGRIQTAIDAEMQNKHEAN
jgi:hypothetical protein